MTDIDPTPAEQFAIQVVERLRDGGHTAFWAGGCVRDRLLARKPKDYDVATSAPPEEVRALFGRRRTVEVGAAFGVIIVHGPREAGPVEVATFRTDATYSDGRHPDSVRFSTPEEDAQRRDFTINGLFFDPVEDKVIDYVGGQADLEQGIIRAIGNPEQRIAEDKLRMLRGIRFATTFGFALDEETAKAIEKHANEVTIVSAERIADEMRKILRNDARARGVRLLNETGLLGVLIPESQQIAGPPHQAWQQTLDLLDRLVDPPFGLALAALVRQMSNTDSSNSEKISFDAQIIASAICKRWKLSKEETALAGWLLANETTIRQADQWRWPPIQRLLVHADSPTLMQLAEGVAEVELSEETGLRFCRERLLWSPDRLNPTPLLNGDDLIKAGLKAGRQFGPILTQIRDAQLEGRLTSSEEAMQLAWQLYEESRVEGPESRDKS